MSRVTLGEIADFVEGEYSGPRDGTVTGVASLADATEEQVSFLSNPKYAEQMESTRAAAILVGPDTRGSSPRLIRVKNPYFAMARVLTRWFADRPMPSGISPLASIASTARIGQNAAIGPFATVADGVVIGDNTKIFSGVSIEAESIIGSDTIIYPQVSIYERSRIGSRCIIHSGVVIGGDGYGFATEGGRHHKIPQVGIVRIEDDVEIGAGSTIDRAALGETVIGEGTKIDNLVQIGHNVRIGKHCFLVAQVGIAGSTTIGDYVAMAGQTGAVGHITIGSGAQIAAKSAVFDDVPPNTKMRGIPAVPWREYARREIWSGRLAELARRVEELEKKLAER